MNENRCDVCDNIIEGTPGSVETIHVKHNDDGTHTAETINLQKICSLKCHSLTHEEKP